MNSFAFLDEIDEWYYNAEDRCVYMIWGAGQALPALADTRFSISEDESEDLKRYENAGLAFWGSVFGDRLTEAGANLEIRGISVYQAAGHGIRVRNVRQLDAVDLAIHSSGMNGISIATVADSARITRNRIENTTMNGITVFSAPHIEIAGNTILRTGAIEMQPTMEMNFNGINVLGQYSSLAIENNKIVDVGFAAMLLSDPVPLGPQHQRKSGLTIANNEVARFCALLNDCGAIHINAQNRDPSDSASVLKSGKRISGNRIIDPIGNVDGTPQAFGVTVADDGMIGDRERLVAAVFLDHKASHYDVRDNVIGGTYGRYSWIIRVRGTANSCSRDTVDACMSRKGRGAMDTPYRCYTDELERCNLIQ